MTGGFKRDCGQCGARLATVQRILHPCHLRRLVRGSRGKLYTFTSEVVWIAVALTVLAAIVKALK